MVGMPTTFFSVREELNMCKPAGVDDLGGSRLTHKPSPIPDIVASIQAQVGGRSTHSSSQAANNAETEWER